MADPHPKLRVNWTIPAPVISTIVAQAAALAFTIATWKASTDSTIIILEKRISILEQLASNNNVISERVKGVDVKIEVIQNQAPNTESKIDKLIDRGSHR